MEQNKPRTNSPQLDADTIKQFLQHQQQHLALEAERLRLEEKRIDTDAKLAERSMELNAELLRAEPGQKHKSTITTAIVFTSLTLIFFGFIGWLVYAGKEEFVLKFLNWLVHLVFGIIGFFVGKATTKQKKDDNNKSSSAIEDAEIVKIIA